MAAPAAAVPEETRRLPAAVTHALLLGSVVVWGSTFVAMKHLLGHVSPLEIVGLRFAIGLPLLWGIVAWKRIPLAFERSDRKALALGSAVLAAHFLLQPLALTFVGTTATNTGWIITFSPLWIAILSWFLLGERLGLRQAGGIALATGGVLLLVSGGRGAGLFALESAGDWLIFFTSFTWGLYTVTTRQLARRRGPLAVTLVAFVPLSVGCLVVMAFRSDWAALARLPAAAVGSLLFLGVLGTLAQWCWQLGVANLGPTRAGLYVYLQPLATSLLAARMLGERAGVSTAAGGALVLAGVAWAQTAPAARPGRTDGG